MVSHSMDDMARLARRLLVFSRGALVMDGTPSEVFAEQERMEEIGLGVPEAARLCHMMRQEGFDLPGNIYRSDELKEQLLRLWNERKDA